jgi:hypothetical protein
LPAQKPPACKLTDALMQINISFVIYIAYKPATDKALLHKGSSFTHLRFLR